MDDLISRSALIALIKKRLKNTAIIGWLCRIISEVPTIEAEPVRHGRWKVDSRTGMSFCSECWDYAVETDTNYCPNCGAKMDGGADDATD